MRVLLTGGNGFVGRHAAQLLHECGHDVIVAGRPAHGPVDVPLELGDLDNVRGVVELSRPEAVLHLAGIASVRVAGEDPLAAYDINALGTARLFVALGALGTPVHVVLASSGEVYGARDPADYPVDETVAPAPLTSYGASKLAAEAFALAATAGRPLTVSLARSFNHIGPGQADSFVVAAFAKRIAAIKRGTAADAKLFVGNLEPRRDFLDVRDVVRAYGDLLEQQPAGAFNVCSGMPVAIKDILRQLVTIARVGVEIRESPELVRSVDAPLAYGSNAKLRAATGWAPAITLAASLRAVYEAALTDQAPVAG